MPLFNDVNATIEYPIGTPTFRNTVESVKSRCSREIGSFADKCSNTALASPRFPSEFSKSIGFTYNDEKKCFCQGLGYHIQLLQDK